MRINWSITKKDIERLNTFIASHINSPKATKRIKTNLADEKSRVTKAVFWKHMVWCLLTTQQRSGPDSYASKYMHKTPFPLTYTKCKNLDEEKLREYVRKSVSENSLNRCNKIADEVLVNLEFLEHRGWNETLETVNSIRVKTTRESEKKAAIYIANNFKGFGPKQSRNLLQLLGFSQYETPLDSRITKWLNEFGFPVTLSATALQDKNYYDFVSDGFQKLAKAGGISPCVLDAIIFDSYDR